MERGDLQKEIQNVHKGRGDLICLYICVLLEM